MKTLRKPCSTAFAAAKPTQPAPHIYLFILSRMSDRPPLANSLRSNAANCELVCSSLSRCSTCAERTCIERTCDVAVFARRALRLLAAPRALRARPFCSNSKAFGALIRRRSAGLQTSAHMQFRHTARMHDAADREIPVRTRSWVGMRVFRGKNVRDSQLLAFECKVRISGSSKQVAVFVQLCCFQTRILN